MASVHGAALCADEARVIGLVIEPAETTLKNADDSVQLLVNLKLSDGTVRDVTRDAEYSTVKSSKESSDSAGKVAIDHGRITPKSNGVATINVNVRDAQDKTISADARIVVQNLGNDRQIHFANEVMPILTKAGCNTGGCHGKSGGQNGFALTLFASDHEFDYDSIVHQGRGRRLFPAAPEQSLLLIKGTGQTTHGGGTRLEAKSEHYDRLLRWIAQGMPRGDTNAPTVARIEVLPRERTMKRISHQQLRVVACLSDGSTRDVTREAEYKSQEPDILTVEATGLISTLNHTGEGVIMVRYMGAVDVAKITVPFNEDVPESAYAHFKSANYIDELTLQKWHKLGIAPSPVCSDEIFIRRAYIDAIGTLPASEEVLAFLADQSPGKREKLIDRILERNEYGDYWANVWGDLLRNWREADSRQDMKRGTFAFSAWLRNSFIQNKSYDQFVREILTAQGDVGSNGAVNWYRAFTMGKTPNITQVVNDSCQVFLGTQVACANCHNHPLEKLSRDEYWSFAAYFEHIAFKPETRMDSILYVSKEITSEVKNDINNISKGKFLPPRPLGGKEIAFEPGEDPRVKLVNWMTAPENPYFTKAIANRMWGHFMNLGLVESVDDMRATNPPSNPLLLDALAKDFVAHKFDLKHLIGVIMKSQTYGLSSDPTPYNQTDRQNFARYMPRRMPAEVFLDAISKFTGVPERYNGFPLGTRAIELPDNAVASYFLKTFGRSPRASACACERRTNSNLAQTLYLMNSPDLDGKLSNGTGYIATLLNANKPPEQIVEEMYLRSLARKPTADELKDAAEMVASATDRKNSVKDFAWILLNCKEFEYNH